LTVREVLTEEDKRAFRERINQIEEVALQVREAADLARLSPAEERQYSFLGTITELNKVAIRGELVLEDGSSVACYLAGRHPSRLYRYFADDGLLLILGHPVFEEGHLVSIAVEDIRRGVTG
jgi:hypothetical protein